MRHSAKAQFAVLGSALTTLTLILAACGGGGTSSGAGAGGSAVASVSGTVNDGSPSALKLHPGVGPAYLIAAFGDMVIRVAYAGGVPGVNVVVNCPGAPPHVGVTDALGKFRVLAREITTSTHCGTTFDDVVGPDVIMAPGMETEIEVTLAGNVVHLVGVEQRANNQAELEIEVDDDASNVASHSDDDSSDGLSDDAASVSNEDDDSQSIDHASNDDHSSGGTGSG